MDYELQKYLEEEQTIFPGIDLTEEERREQPCWDKYAESSPSLLPPLKGIELIVENSE